MELYLTIPLWIILVQFIAIRLNNSEFCYSVNLKKYLAATQKIESIDALSFNTLVFTLASVCFGQVLTMYFSLEKGTLNTLFLFLALLITTLFSGAFRFRLTYLRKEVLDISYIVIAQATMIVSLFFAYKLTHDIPALLIVSLLFMYALMVVTELELIKASNSYNDIRYKKIQSSFIRILVQSFLSLSIFSLFISNYTIDMGNTSVLVRTLIYILMYTFFQLVTIGLSNFYLKFLPNYSYADVNLNSRKRVIRSLVFVIIICVIRIFLIV